MTQVSLTTLSKPHPNCTKLNLKLTPIYSLKILDDPNIPYILKSQLNFKDLIRVAAGSTAQARLLSLVARAGSQGCQFIRIDGYSRNKS